MAPILRIDATENCAHDENTHGVLYMECIEMVLPYIWLASATSFECELANNGCVDFALAHVMNTTFI